MHHRINVFIPTKKRDQSMEISDEKNAFKLEESLETSPIFVVSVAI